jgi:hypothetical protein
LSDFERLRTALAGRYHIDRELGHGGMATVYLAQDLKHDRPVAVKVLRAELAAALGADGFLREIKITARLTHPHILPLHDSGEADGFLFYVMPYVVAAGRAQWALRLGAALLRYWEARELLTEGRQRLVAALELPEAQERTKERARACLPPASWRSSKATTQRHASWSRKACRSTRSGVMPGAASCA